MKCVCLCVARTSFCVWGGSNETCCTNRRLSDSPCQAFIPWLVLSLRLLLYIRHVFFLSILFIHPCLFVADFPQLVLWVGWRWGGGFSGTAIQKSSQSHCCYSETQQPDTDTCCSQKPINVCHSARVHGDLLPWDSPGSCRVPLQRWLCQGNICLTASGKCCPGKTMFLKENRGLLDAWTM